MAVSRTVDGQWIVTALAVASTPEPQLAAASLPVGDTAVDTANGRLFQVVFDQATGRHVWRMAATWTGLAGQQTMVWGGAALTVSASPRILDAYSTTRNGGAVVGGITVANFTTLSGLAVEYACRITGVRWVRAGNAGAINTVGVFRNGALIGATFNIAAAGPTSGVFNFPAAVSLAAGDRLASQATFAVATTTQFIVQALILPPA
jgi:hypothetical protein